MDTKDRRLVENQLENNLRWKTRNADWRSWNLSRFRAHYLVETRLSEGGEVKRR